MFTRELGRAMHQSVQDESIIQENIEVPFPEFDPFLSSTGGAILFVHRAIAEGKISM